MSRLALSGLYGVLQAPRTGYTSQPWANIPAAVLQPHSMPDWTPPATTYRLRYSALGLLTKATIRIYGLVSGSTKTVCTGRVTNRLVLAPGWGDGSGTGSVRLLFVSHPGLTAQWMGVWLLHVSYFIQQELRTLLNVGDRLRGRTTPVHWQSELFFLFHGQLGDSHCLQSRKALLNRLPAHRTSQARRDSSWAVYSKAMCSWHRR
jgi:hypothetical protein